MKQLTSFGSRADSGSLTKKLEDNKIPYFIMANTDVDVNPATNKADGVKVMVNDEDYEKAKGLV